MIYGLIKDATGNVTGTCAFGSAPLPDGYTECSADDFATAKEGLMNGLRVRAQAALDRSDTTVIRCGEHGVSVPAEWISYRASLRSIVNGSLTAATLPTQPAYPAGT